MTIIVRRRRTNGIFVVHRSDPQSHFQERHFQEALVEIARLESTDLNAALARIAAVAAETLEVSRASVWLFNEDHTELRCLHLFDRGRNAHESGAILEVGKYPRYFQALEESRTIAANDARTDPSTSEFAVGYLDVLKIFSMLDVPIRREGRVVGVLCNEHTGAIRSWSLDEQNFAASLADLISLVLETNRRRQAEHELRGSLNQLELLFSQSLDGFFFMMLDEPVYWGDGIDREKVLDHIFEHQRITKVNDALLRQYGASRSQYLGRRPKDVFAHDLARGREFWRQMLDTGHRRGESEEHRLDGSRMWLDGDYICIYDPAGRVAGHFGIQRDITERKQAEAAIQRYSQRLKLLRQTDRAILSARSVTEIAEAALARFHQLVPCERASVAVVQPDGVTVRLVGVLTSLKTQLGVGSQLRMDLFGDPDDLRQGRPYVIPDLMHSPFAPARAALEADGIRSIVAVPLLANGVLLGTLNLSSRHADAFSPEHVEIAQDVADNLAVAIQHASLNERVADHAADLERRVKERTLELSETNAKLRESEERLRALYDTTPVMMHSLDENGCLLEVNQFWLDTLGYDRDEVMGRPVIDFASPEYRDAVKNVVMPRLARDGFIKDVEVQGLKKNGETVDLVASSVVKRDADGRFVRSQTFLVDKTEQRRTERENLYLQEELQSELNFEEIVGASPTIQKVFNAIEMVAPTDSTVLLLGETGTGKELIARALHNRSRRKQSVMVKVNCGALPASLVESELFGHEKGAFTGAAAQKKGRFEIAHRGTIFLDEAGEIPLEAQTKLLRVLQEQEFERVGGAQTLKVDVRVIAATNRDLEQEVRRGTFRADLYYRLNVFPIEVPPLRDRRDDIPMLASYFVGKFAQRMGKRIHGIQRSVHDQLYHYDWPGNVRELANLLERAVILCQGDTLQTSHLTVGKKRAATTPAEETLPTLEDGERQLIRRALERTGGVLAGPNGAAELLGINRSTLWSRMRKLGIELPKGRSASSRS